MWELTIMVALLLIALLYAQRKHYDFVRESRAMDNSVQLTEEITRRLKDLDDTKRRVDVLTLKAGFKL